MAKVFNVNGACRPDVHYMVDLESRLESIKEMVDSGEYFVINRGRQYGKTTILKALADFLEKDYTVLSMDFQTFGSLSFEKEESFVIAFAGELLDCTDDLPEEIGERLMAFADGTAKICSLNALFRVIKVWCMKADKAPVLMIDEVDSASNNQVFLDFLAQLRAYYLKRPKAGAFQSVILAGVYDIRNIKRKIRPEAEHNENSPWNIAAKFTLDMNFSVDEIAGMLQMYEDDYHTGMCIDEIAKQIWEYTSGYPVLVSNLCKIMDEEISGNESFPDKLSVWTKAGVDEAVKRTLEEQNPLFGSMWEKLNRYPEMRQRVYALLFQGQRIPFNIDDPVTNLLYMFGYVKNADGSMQIANRVFETRLYNYFLMTEEAAGVEIFQLGVQEKSQFIRYGKLDMDHLLAKFVEYFDDIYGDRDEKFVEDEGRRYFMLFLKPIINGTGNYYVEARTRNRKQTDLIVDYRGTQHIVELKIWHGNEYNERGEKQLSEYLDYYHLDKGYMLSFCFNKKKKIGLHKVKIGDRLLVEAVV
ncbi:MAG: ATP-binding protein [Lachnospiraceae bacterium]|nr:ATP-binding protein [Lachnospiraceae bacterium]